MNGNGKSNENEKAIEKFVLNAGYYKVRDKEEDGNYFPGVDKGYSPMFLLQRRGE